MTRVQVLQEGALRLSALSGDLAKLYADPAGGWKACSIDEGLVGVVLEGPPSGRAEWKARVKAVTSRMVTVLCGLCDEVGFDLCKVVLGKMELNAVRYPPGVSLYEGDDVTSWKSRADNMSGKGRAMEVLSCKLDRKEKRGWNRSSFQAGMAELKGEVRKFALQRGFCPRYNPLSLTLAIASEVGELCGCLQWLTSNMMVADVAESRMADLLEEVADVAIYCLHVDGYLEEEV